MIEKKPSEYYESGLTGLQEKLQFLFVQNVGEKLWGAVEEWIVLLLRWYQVEWGYLHQASPLD